MTGRRGGHVQQRGEGSWRLKYDAPADERTGERRTRYATVRGTRKEAERELRRLMREADTGVAVDPNRMTVSELLGQFIEEKRRETLRKDQPLSPKTFARYQEIAVKHLVPALGHHRLAALRTAHIEDAWGEALVSGNRRRGGGLARLTLRHHHTLLRQALEWGVRRELLGRNPASAVDRKKFLQARGTTASDQWHTVTSDQVPALLASLAEYRLFVPVLLALSTGMRRGEICALRWGNVDLDRGLVTVAEAFTQVGTTLHLKGTKSHRARVVTLGASTTAKLRKHKAAQAEHLLALGVRQTGDTLVHTQTDGEPVKPASITSTWTAFRAAHNLPGVRFHDLRHSHASLLYELGIPEKVIQERLGHTTIGITMDIYTHLRPAAHASAAEAVDNALRTALDGDA